MAGIVLAGAALLWVATRPSLRPQAAEARNADVPPVLTNQDSPLPQAPATNAPAVGAPTLIAEMVEPQRTLPVAVAEAPQTNSPVPFPAPAVADGKHDLTIYESAEPIKTIKFHIVRRGETLSHIAQQYYGSKEQWRKILAANAKTIRNADKIAPGTKLILPE